MIEQELDQLIGAMVIMGFEGTDITAAPVAQVKEYLDNNLLGGVILFQRNIESPQQLLRLNHELKSASFIAIDQEGGVVQRLRAKNGFTDYTSAHDIASCSGEQAANQYSNMAYELKEFGFNLNFAPCVDLDDSNSPIISKLGRSFSTKVKNVVDYAEIVIDAHHSQQVFTAIKHFPGHGYAPGDTHLSLVDVTNSFRLEELQPFYQLIAKDKVDMIMTAHIIDKNIDPVYPITLSPIALKSLLRDKGYDGVIITDDLFMGAILQNYPLEESVIASIIAGADLMIFSNNKLACKNIVDFEPDYNLPHKIIKIVKQAIKDGIITLERLLESHRRIEKLKQKWKTDKEL
jgi:beta-N-acetylhexosaminidase